MNTIKKLVMGSIVLAIILGITGCAPANITAQLRDSDANSNMITRCEEFDMRSNGEMKKVLEKYDGWRLIFVSEYTTGNKLGTSGTACFEKPYVQ